MIQHLRVFAGFRHFYGGEVERPVRVTHYFKKREERAVNPILQTYAGYWMNVEALSQ